MGAAQLAAQLAGRLKGIESVREERRRGLAYARAWRVRWEPHFDALERSGYYG